MGTDIGDKLDQILEKLNVIPSMIDKTYVSEKLSSLSAHDIDVSSYENYKTFTVNNFSAEIVDNVAVIGSDVGNANFAMSYDNDAGILHCTAGCINHNPGGYFIGIGAYYKVVLFT